MIQGQWILLVKKEFLKNLENLKNYILNSNYNSRKRINIKTITNVLFQRQLKDKTQVGKWLMLQVNKNIVQLIKRFCQLSLNDNSRDFKNIFSETLTKLRITH